jgi:aryl-alcohol dehydrogenase-like predicted oxidoreductase
MNKIINKNNKLILGTVQMGLKYGINNINGKISREECNKIFEKAFESNIRILDTAEAYGNSHDIIGKFHENNPNFKFKVNTKLANNIDLKQIDGKISNYLKELHIDQIETLMFHGYNSYHKNKLLIEKMVSLKKMDVIKNIGVSIYTNAEIESILNDDNVSVIQLPFNLLDNMTQKNNLLTQIKKSGKISQSRSAFLQGIFFKDLNKKNKIIDQLKKELIQLKNLTIKYKCSMQELALSYCLCQKEIDNVLIGVDSSEQLVKNISAAKFKIDINLINEINKIKVENVDLINPSLWN